MALLEVANKSAAIAQVVAQGGNAALQAATPSSREINLNDGLSGSPAAAQSELAPASAAGCQPSLFSHGASSDRLQPKSSGNLDSLHQPLRFDGSDYLPWRDDERLSNQFWRVFLLMRDGVWRSLRQISDETHSPESSASAQLRHCRKDRFGGHAVEKRYLGEGLYQYRLIENKEWTGAIATRAKTETAGAITPTAS